MIMVGESLHTASPVLHLGSDNSHTPPEHLTVNSMKAMIFSISRALRKLPNTLPWVLPNVPAASAVAERDSDSKWVESGP